MRLVFYFALARHPCCRPEMYDHIFPGMFRSAKRAGYDPPIHLTDLHDKARSEPCLRFDVPTDKVMLAREMAWCQFLEHHADPNETYLMIEPDSRFVRPVPPLNGDLMILWRPFDSIFCGVRMCKKSALPFYQAVRDAMLTMPEDRQGWHGDVDAHHIALHCRKGVPPKTQLGNLTLDVRQGRPYSWSEVRKDTVLLNFKGKSKALLARLDPP